MDDLNKQPSSSQQNDIQNQINTQTIINNTYENNDFQDNSNFLSQYFNEYQQETGNSICPPSQHHNDIEITPYTTNHTTIRNSQNETQQPQQTQKNIKEELHQKEKIAQKVLTRLDAEYNNLNLLEDNILAYLTKLQNQENILDNALTCLKKGPKKNNAVEERLFQQELAKQRLEAALFNEDDTDDDEDDSCLI